MKYRIVIVFEVEAQYTETIVSIMKDILDVLERERLIDVKVERVE